MSTLLFVQILTSAPPGQDHVTFQADGLGSVDVTTSFLVGGYPTSNFRSSSGQLLYTLPLGSGDPDIFRIETDSPHDPPAWSRLGPRVVSYFVIQPEHQKVKLLAIAMYTGGSDCGYVPALVGVVEGKLKSLLVQQPVVNSQGGLYVGDLGGRRGFGLAAWTFLWEDGAHYGRHRYRVTLYRIDADTGKSTMAYQKETKRSYSQASDALHELGFHFDNFLSLSPALEC